MLYVYFGTDRQAVRDAAADFVEQHLPPDGTITTLEAASFTPGQLADTLGATSLFGGAQWFLFDTPSDNVEFLEAVQQSLQELNASTNTFLVLEGPLLAPAKKAYGKYAVSLTEFAAQKVDRFNSFAIAEAVAAKDKRRLWMLIQEARLNNLRTEEIIGMMWWQLKSLRLAEVTGNAAEAGMKEFPYGKAKHALKHFQAGEIATLSRSLLELYHAGHGGIRDMDMALEQWALSI